MTLINSRNEKVGVKAGDEVYDTLRCKWVRVTGRVAGWIEVEDVATGERWCRNRVHLKPQE